MVHERCLSCFELDLVLVKFEVMLGDASLQVKNSAIMILGDIF